MSNLPTVIFLQKPNNFETKYLVGNPDITFFKSVYRRYTNFSKFTTSILNTKIQPTQYQYKISSFAGDLLSKVYLDNSITFSGTSTTIPDNLGTEYLNHIDFSISSIRKPIFTNDSVYLEAKSELSNDIVFSHSGSYTTSPYLTITNDGNIVCVNGNKYQNTTLSGGVGGMTISEKGTANFFTIPDFSFMKDYGLSIPLLCLNNTDVFLDCYIKNKYANDSHTPLTQKCIVEYINLDLAEKKRFKLNDHEYVIEEIRKTSFNINFDSSPQINLNESNDVIKQLFFIGFDEEENEIGEISADATFQLKLDNEIFQDKIDTKTLTRYNVYQHYKGSGRKVFFNACNTPAKEDYGLIDSIGVISFCLYPNNYTQPSGSISIFNNRTLSIIHENANNIRIYKSCYNLLKFSNGDARLNITS